MCSEIQTLLAGLLIDVLFLPQKKLPNVQLRPLTMSSLKNTSFQNNMCAETPLGEFAISLVLVISCEPVNIETENRNFSDLEVQLVYRWQQNYHPCSNILAYVHIYIYRDIAILIDG